MKATYQAPLRLRDMAAGERPQERLETYGAKALSDTELLAMLLRSGSKSLDVIGLSSRLIAEAGSLAGLLTWTENDFKKLNGIGRVKALQLITVMEVARRVLMQKGDTAPVFDTPEKVCDYFRPIAAGIEVEKFWALCLNRKNRLIKQAEVSSGTATSSLAHPREVFREAIRVSAAAVICVHNHPSGDPMPSADDCELTKRLREASRAVGIDMLDHVIIGRPAADPAGHGFYSFSQAGLLEK